MATFRVKVSDGTRTRDRRTTTIPCQQPLSAAIRFPIGMRVLFRMADFRLTWVDWGRIPAVLDPNPGPGSRWRHGAVEQDAGAQRVSSPRRRTGPSRCLSLPRMPALIGNCRHTGWEHPRRGLNCASACRLVHSSAWSTGPRPAPVERPRPRATRRLVAKAGVRRRFAPRPPRPRPRARSRGRAAQRHPTPARPHHLGVTSQGSTYKESTTPRSSPPSMLESRQ
jgi:hypothetical protein